MPDLPSSLALTNIADGSTATAAPVRNNFSSVQTAVNALITALSGGTAGQVLTASDSDTIAYANVGLAYRKTTEKDVVNTVAETDLLNGEVTVGAGVMSTNKTLRATLVGDFLNDSGGTRTPRLRIKLGGTTIFDDVFGALGVQAARRRPWRIQFEITNLGAANSQFMGGLVFLGNAEAAGTTTTGIGDLGAVADQSRPIASDGLTAIDTAVAAALVVSIEHSAAHASLSWRLKSALVEVV